MTNDPHDETEIGFIGEQKSQRVPDHVYWEEHEDWMREEADYDANKLASGWWILIGAALGAVIIALTVRAIFF